MIKAGIKKELMLFTRGFKLLGVIITIVAISLLYPFTYKSMELMANQISDMGQQMGGETQGQVENAAASINNMLGSISEMYGGSMAAVGFKTGVSSLTSTGSLIIMLLLRKPTMSEIQLLQKAMWQPIISGHRSGSRRMQSQSCSPRLIF